MYVGIPARKNVNSFLKGICNNGERQMRQMKCGFNCGVRYQVVVTSVEQNLLNPRS